MVIIKGEWSRGRGRERVFKGILSREKIELNCVLFLKLVCQNEETTTTTENINFINPMLLTNFYSISKGAG